MAIGSFCTASILVCCGGGFVLLWLGLNVVTADIERQVRDHPTFRKHIGEIENLSFNIMKTGAIDDENAAVYDVDGSRNNGELTVYSTNDWDTGEIISAAELRLENGDVFDLDIRELHID